MGYPKSLIKYKRNIKLGIQNNEVKKKQRKHFKKSLLVFLKLKYNEICFFFNIRNRQLKLNK